MIIVGISQRIDHIHERNEYRDALDQKLIQWVQACGFTPIPIPNNIFVPTWLSAINPKAIILSGGNNIGEYTDRDHTEKRLLEYANHCKLPVLGLCRGMQMMGLFSGASLHAVAGHVNTRHQLHGVFTHNVNSFHAFSLMSCPDNFQVIARAEDGAIEAIKHNTLPWEGWMWHPERELKFDTNDIERLRGLFHG